MIDDPKDDPWDFPEMFIRKPEKKDEATPMKTPEKVTASDESVATEAPSRSTAKRRAATKAKSNGKAPVKAKPKTPAKAKAPKKARAERKVDPAKLDDLGFRKGSLKSQAAAMYANAKTKGATLGEVKKALKSTQFNLITELQDRKDPKITVTRSQENGEGARQVTRYRINKK